MGFRFRRSINLGSGVRLNLGSKSVGLSAGVRGLRISSNTRTGTRVTVGIPGTGMSYSHKVDLSGVKEDLAHLQSQLQPPAERIFDRYDVPLYDALLQKSELNLDNRYSVHVKAGTINWLWMCPCCGTPLPDPLIGSKPIEDTGVFLTPMHVDAVNMRHCDTCNKHLELSLEALSHEHEEVQPTFASTTMGVVVSVIVWIVGWAILSSMTASSLWVLFLPTALALVPIAWGLSSDLKATEEAKQQAQYANNRAARYYQEAGEATTPDCACCYSPAVIAEQQGAERIFHFAYDKYAMAFAKLNHSNVLAWCEPELSQTPS